MIAWCRKVLPGLRPGGAGGRRGPGDHLGVTGGGERDPGGDSARAGGVERVEGSTGAGPGLRFVVQKVLRAGIVLLGARFYLADVARIGGGAIGLILLCMTVALAFALLVGRRLQFACGWRC